MTDKEQIIDIITKLGLIVKHDNWELYALGYIRVGHEDIDDFCIIQRDCFEEDEDIGGSMTYLYEELGDFLIKVGTVKLQNELKLLLNI